MLRDPLLIEHHGIDGQQPGPRSDAHGLQPCDFLHTNVDDLDPGEQLGSALLGVFIEKRFAVIGHSVQGDIAKADPHIGAFDILDLLASHAHAKAEHFFPGALGRCLLVIIKITKIVCQFTLPSTCSIGLRDGDPVGVTWRSWTNRPSPGNTGQVERATAGLRMPSVMGYAFP